MSALRLGIRGTVSKEGFGVADRDDEFACMTVTARGRRLSVVTLKTEVYDLVAAWVLGKPELLARIKAEIEVKENEYGPDVHEITK